MEGPITLPSGARAKLTSSRPMETPSFLQKFFSSFSIFRTKRKETPFAIKPTTQISDRKLILKPILHRHHGGMDSRIDASPYLWPHDSTFEPKTTALVIIDMQKDCKFYLHIAFNMRRQVLLLIIGNSHNPHFRPWSYQETENEKISLHHMMTGSFVQTSANDS